MLSLVSLTAAVPPTATALRAAGVPITDADEQKVVALAEHVLQVYSACEQKIHQVLCVIGSVCEHYDYDSSVLLLLGKSMQAVGVTLQLVSPEAALVNKLGASASLPHRLRAVQLVLVDVARPDVFEGVRRLGWSATKDGFPRVLATTCGWAVMGGPQDTALDTILDTVHHGQVVLATLPTIVGFTLGKCYDPSFAAVTDSTAAEPALGRAACSAPRDPVVRVKEEDVQTPAPVRKRAKADDGASSAVPPRPTRPTRLSGGKGKARM